MAFAPWPSGGVLMSRSLRSTVLVAALCALLPVAAGAQSRGHAVPRPPAALRPPRPPAVATRGEFIFVGGYFYDPLFGPYPWWMHTAYPRWYAPAFEYRAELRVQAKPKEAAVYVDGFYAGIVDDFDGIFQRLLLPPGGHAITLYLAGYRTINRSLYLRPHATTTLHETMALLPPGVVSELPPIQPLVPPPPPGSFRQPRTPPPVVAAPPPIAGDVEDYATLDLRIVPRDATVLIDNMIWPAAADGHLVVQLGEGMHTIDVAREGYRRFTTSVDLVQGETTSFSVGLTREP